MKFLELTLKAAICVSILSAWAVGPALANEAFDPGGTEGTSTPQFQPKVGEQPEYGKKYYPTEIRSDLFLEVNPVLFIKRGVQFEFERRVGESWSLGADAQYRNSEPFDENGVKGRLEYLALAPKVRIYPMSTMSGVFFGVKAFIGQVTTSIVEVGQTTKKEFLQIAPAVHVGYRLTAMGGFTLALYLGGGVNLPIAELERDASKGSGWEEARVALNEENGRFRSDYGLTLGIAL